MVRLGSFSLRGGAYNGVRAETWSNMSMTSNDNQVRGLARHSVVERNPGYDD